MYCSHCGTAMSEDARFCPSCGTAVASTTAENHTNRTQADSVNTFIPPKLDLLSEPSDNNAPQHTESDNFDYDDNIRFDNYYRSATLRALVSALLIIAAIAVGIYLVITQTQAVDYVQGVITDISDSII